MYALPLLVAAIILILLGVFLIKWFLYVGIVVAVIAACVYFFGGGRVGRRRV